MKSLITKCRSEILQQKKFFAFFIDLQRKRRKQNHKISYQFFAAPPCTPRRFKRKGKEIFGFGSRLEGARGADCQYYYEIRAYDLVQSHHALRACEANQNPQDFVHTEFELRSRNTASWNFSS